jgi:N-acetylglucosaminyldiphosphoundecaprenol N-acetyl-beta-D-mannosaminyltransferase
MQVEMVESQAVTGPDRAARRERPRAWREPVWALGLPVAPLTMAGTLAEVERLIEARRPSYVITANLNYAMLSDRDPALRAVNGGAALILADGMPLVWAARRRGTPLPERVAGSDLIYTLSELAARQGYRLFLLGGAPGVGEAAAANLRARYPGLDVAGIESPPYRPLDEREEAALVARIRAARPDILIMAFGQPAGEIWAARHCQAVEVPVCIQLGASLDFAAARVRRAPRWIQKSGLEWAFRLALEPRRLGLRYARNALFLARCAVRGGGRPCGEPEPASAS